jgi:hypothetical protein
LWQFDSQPFTAHSQNKRGGTADIPEHRASPFVVGAGNEKHVRRYSMINRFMISAAAVALIAGTGFANAQGTGMSREGSGSTVQQSAPSADHAGTSASPANRDAAEPTKPSSGMKATQSEQKSPAAGKNQRAEDNMPGQKSKSMSSENDNTKGGSKEMKAEGREDRNGSMKAEGREDRNGNMKAESKGEENRSQTTTGQAGAGAKLSTEQRTKITTVIRDQHVAPVNNVNFSIAVGTRVPRDVSFHPLPVEVVTVYPEWRGYEFFLVHDQIIVVDPRTLEIVAVLEA